MKAIHLGTHRNWATHRITGYGHGENRLDHELEIGSSNFDLQKLAVKLRKHASFFM